MKNSSDIVMFTFRILKLSCCFYFHFLAWLYLLHLHTARDGVPLAEDLVQVLRAQDVPQGGLRQQPDWLKVDNLATLLGESKEKQQPDWYCPLRFKLTLLSGERSQRLPPRLWHWTPGSRQLHPPILSRNLSWEPAVVFDLKRRASRIGFSMQALITSWGGTSNVIVRRSTFW